MDSLIIQDGFEPYYADRRPFRVAVRATRRLEVRVGFPVDRKQPETGDRSAPEPSSARGDKGPQ